MGKNILILTHQYSSDTRPNGRWTKVVSYFAHEWSKDNNVLVIINSSKFPKFYYLFGWILRWVAKKNSKDPALIEDQSWRHPFDFNDDGINVYNRPMLKFWPHAYYGGGQIKRQVKDIISICKKNDFKPDIIDAHWLNPQIDLLLPLGDYYQAKTALVLHSEAITPRYFTKSVEHKLNKIGRLGCRSHFGAKMIFDNLNLKEKPFVCSSGISDKYVEDAISEKSILSKSKIKVVTVSRLMDWKCIDAAITGVCQALIDKSYEYQIIGDGPERPRLQDTIKKLGVEDNVALVGKQPRGQVIERLKDADIFVLISKHETFGLVYLEAMLQGCIAVGSQNGGIDGIIVNGSNGFLSPEGDATELEKTLRKIITMSGGELHAISDAAITTAKEYTDSKVATRYLNEIA